MKILVIGAGVLGCNVAKDLYKAGKDITLLARGSWYEEIKRNGLKVKNKFTGITSTYHINVTNELKPDDYYDCIFVSLRFTQLASLFTTLNQNVSTNIIFNGNNTRTAELISALPGKNIMFSFALAAGTRKDNKVESIDLKKITIGESAKENNNKALIDELFAGTGYKVVYEPNMQDYLLSHAAFVVPVSFACYYTGGDLKKIRRDTDYLDKIIKATIECYEAVDLGGHKILPEADSQYKSDTFYKNTMKFFKLMCSTFLGKVCASDHAMSAADEMNALADDIKSLMSAASSDSTYFDEARKPIYDYLK